MNSDLTIIVPLYNEEQNVMRFVLEMNQYLEVTPIESIVLFVNDGSTDRSQELLQTVCQQNTAYRFIELGQNYGLSTAIKAGIDTCDTSLVGYIDSDIQTSPMDFLKYFFYFPDYDLVTGIRINRKDNLIKKISSKIGNTFRRIMINDGIQDSGCPLKIMKASFAKRIPFFDGMHRFIPALIQLQEGKVKQIPINHYPRFAGTAKYHLYNRIKKPLIDTFAFRWIRNRYINYEIKNKG